MEAALITAFKKNFGSSQNVRVHIDSESGEFQVFSLREVVEESMDDFTEISLDEARLENPNYEIGDFVEEEVTPRNFGRIAAQTASRWLYKDCVKLKDQSYSMSLATVNLKS